MGATMFAARETRTWWGRACSAFIEAAAIRALASCNGYSGGLIGGACGRPIRIARLPAVLLTLVSHRFGPEAVIAGNRR
jgi:hypothetical protein